LHDKFAHLNWQHHALLEIETSRVMQEFLLAFLKDSSTVSSVVGWAAFNATAPSGGLILEFGNRTTVRNITGDFVDAGWWDSTVPFPLSLQRDHR
jgi:hypothetical protein